MIEQIVYNYLKEALDVPIYLQMPESLPHPNKSDTVEFVKVEKTGSSENNKIYNATFALQSYACSIYDAALLNEKVKNAMMQIIKLDEVTSVDLNSDYNYTDTSTKYYRYQAVFDLVHY